MTKRKKRNLLNALNMYRHYIIINLTDAKLYKDPWQKSDINKLDRHLKIIKKLINKSKVSRL
jgi:hypothetical protein